MGERIILAHGSGGKMAHELVQKAFIRKLSNPWLDKLDDSAVVGLRGRLAFTTDSYVVSPIFFPGGDIGRLAVCGTVNDLAMSGADPLYLSLALIIEEGLALSDLSRVVDSIKTAADEAGVKIITGDTKVVSRGSADRLFITTSGIGAVPDGIEISGSGARPGDKVLLSGTIGDHGIAVLSCREGFNFKSDLGSDCAPLNGLVRALLSNSRNVRVLRDPTRGGLATTLNEIAAQSGVSIEIEEDRVPVRREVRSACEMLGLDPVYVANEGKLVAVVAAEEADMLVSAMRDHPLGKDGNVIGEVRGRGSGRVVVKTGLGATRVVGMLAGDPLPRIC